jgi:hypothetical protein
MSDQLDHVFAARDDFGGAAPEPASMAFRRGG